MFENATTIYVRPGMVEQVLALLRAEVVPALKSHEGFINLCLLPQYASHTLTVISLWSCRTHAIAAEAACAYRRGIAKLEALLVNGANGLRHRRTDSRLYIAGPSPN